MYLPGEAEHNCNPQIDGHNDNFLDKKNSFTKRISCLISCVQHLNHQKGQTSQYLGRSPSSLVISADLEHETNSGTGEYLR